MTLNSDQGSVVVSVSGAVADLILDRPRKRNAVTPHMLEQLSAHLRRLAANDSIRVVRVRGAGDSTFCTGADLNAFRNLAPTNLWRQWTRLGQEAFAALARLPQTTIAVLSGDALGGGLELAAHCDFRVAAVNAWLGLPEATLGTTPGWAGLAKVADLIGTPRARLMALTGRSISAADAAAWGLVDLLADEDPLDRVVDTLVEDLLRTGPGAQRILKAQLSNGSSNRGELAILVESLGSAVTAWEGESAEGVAALVERRSARWHGAAKSI